MIQIRKAIRNQLTLIMGFLMIYISLHPVQPMLYADIPNPEPSQQRSNVSYNRQTFQAGDAIQISVYPDTASFLHGTFPIDGEGFISLPIKGKVKISNMSESNFIEYLNENFSQYIKTPTIQVRPLVRASLIGGFTTPGLYYVDYNSTLWQLIQKGHGIAHEDGLKKMKWQRNDKTIQKNIIPYFESGKSLREIGFHSGDQLIVPVPDTRSFLEKAAMFLPFISTVLAGYTLYLTYSLAYSR
jgi:protein involved in polysaccharide export with SLBB domain